MRFICVCVCVCVRAQVCVCVEAVLRLGDFTVSTEEVTELVGGGGGRVPLSRDVLKKRTL